jgi:hypothetical protein
MQLNNQKNKVMKKVLLSIMCIIFLASCSDKKYILSADKAAELILFQVSLCTPITDGTITVWQRAINEGKDFSTEVNGYQSRINESDSYKNIENVSKEIDLLMSELSSPNSNTKELHEDLISMYSYEKQLIEKTKNPSGSLLSYSNEIKSVIGEIQNKYNSIKIRVNSLK